MNYCVLLHLRAHFSDQTFDIAAYQRSLLPVHFDNDINEHYDPHIIDEGVLTPIGTKQKSMHLKSSILFCSPNKPKPTDSLNIWLEAYNWSGVFGSLNWLEKSREKIIRMVNQMVLDIPIHHLSMPPGTLRKRVCLNLSLPQPTWPILRSARILPIADSKDIGVEIIVENHANAPFSLENAFIVATSPHEP